MFKNKRMVIIVVVALLIGAAWWVYRIIWVVEPPKPSLLSQWNPDLKIPKVSPSYADEVSAYFAKKKKEQEEYRKNMTQGDKEKEKQVWSKRLSFAQAQLDDITFYGKVIDQYGQPIPDVEVVYDGNSNYFAKCSGRGFRHTDSEGRFVIDNARGDGFSFDKLIKLGYEFQLEVFNFENFKKSDDSALWKDFTADKPFIFRGWKIEKYPRVNVLENPHFKIPQNNEIYFVNLAQQVFGLRSPEPSTKEEGDWIAQINANDHEWTVKIAAINGGIQETKDLYMNLAPTEGYSEFVEYHGKKTALDEVQRSFYFKSHDGKRYGRAKVEMRPYYGDGRGAIFVDSVVNLEGGRNLEVRSKD